MYVTNTIRHGGLACVFSLVLGFTALSVHAANPYVRFLNSSTTNNRLVYYRFGNSGGWSSWSGANTVTKNGGVLNVGGSGDQDRVEYTVYETEQIFYASQGPPLSSDQNNPTIIEVGGSGPVLGDYKMKLKVKNLGQLPRAYSIKSDEFDLDVDLYWPPRTVRPNEEWEEILNALDDPGSVEVGRKTVDANGNVVDAETWIIPADDPAWERTTGDPTTPKVIEDGPAPNVPYDPPDPHGNDGVQWSEPSFNTGDLAKEATLRNGIEAQRALDMEYYSSDMATQAGILASSSNIVSGVGIMSTNIGKMYQASTNVSSLGTTTNGAAGGISSGLTHSNTIWGVVTTVQGWGATNYGGHSGIAITLDARDNPISLDPFEQPYWQNLFNWVKRVVLWGAAFVYVGSVMTSFFTFWRALWQTTPKHIWDMIPVPGVSTAANLGWVAFLTIAAGVMPAIIVVAFSEWSDTLSVDPFAYVDTPVNDPYGGSMNTQAVVRLGIHWLYCCLPVTQLITLAISAYVYELKVGAIYSGLACLFSTRPI